MLKLLKATDESAFHFGDCDTDHFLLFVERQELALDCGVELAEIRPSDSVADGDKHSGPVLTITPFINRYVDRPIALGLIGQYAGRDRADTIQPVRQKSKRSSARLSDNAQDIRLSREDFRRQKNFKIHGVWPVLVSRHRLGFLPR